MRERTKPVVASRYTPCPPTPALKLSRLFERVVLPADVLLDQLFKIALDLQLVTQGVHGGEPIELRLCE